MKITTDACLFGARAEVEESHNILDIGAGTGLLSLMAAQRSNATIDAVELDEQAAQQANDNFQASPWADQLTLHQTSIQAFQPNKTYDTILCNPPFFENSLKAPCNQRSLARHTDSLSFLELAETINRLLSDDGKAWILLPVDSAQRFLEVMDEHPSMTLLKRISVRSSERHEEHRHILVLGKKPSVLFEEQLTVYSEHPEYTAQARGLMSSYYLNG